MKYKEFSNLVKVIAKLRDPLAGCPWDLKQTHQSLLKYLIEESYEYIYAVENTPEKMEEELGDILLQVLLHSQIASEDGLFDIESVAKKLADKMIRRHPHVFSPTVEDRSLLTDSKLQENWDQIKNAENNGDAKNKHKYLFTPESLMGPALQSSAKIGEKTARMNFDWEETSQVAYKVEEEWQELKAEFPHSGTGNQRAIKEELGDLLFSMAQLARHLNIDPEECLREANKKFINRFNGMVKEIENDSNDLLELNQNQLESYWQKIKKIQRNYD